MKSSSKFANNNKEMMNEFIQWSHLTGEYKLIKCSSGNLSQRLNENTMLVSGTGSWLSTILHEQVAVVDIETGKSMNGISPTGELPLHIGIMQHRPEINTVLHFQSEAATSLCCAEIVPDYNVIIEIPLYVGAVATLPYLPPGSAELAEAVKNLPTNICMVQMNNHGQIAMGASLREVIQMAVFFELACQVILNNFNKVKILDKEKTEKLSAYANSRKS